MPSVYAQWPKIKQRCFYEEILGEKINVVEGISQTTVVRRPRDRRRRARKRGCKNNNRGDCVSVQKLDRNSRVESDRSAASRTASLFCSVCVCAKGQTRQYLVLPPRLYGQPFPPVLVREKVCWLTRKYLCRYFCRNIRYAFDRFFSYRAQPCSLC